MVVIVLSAVAIIAGAPSALNIMVLILCIHGVSFNFGSDCSGSNNSHGRSSSDAGDNSINSRYVLSIEN